MPTNLGNPAQAIAWLRTTDAIRSRSMALLALCEQGRSAYFTLDGDALDRVADRVADLTRSTYPQLNVPTHSRWRHFEAGGVDRWPAILKRSGVRDPDEQARMRIDLCVVSVLLDAGAGAEWRFVEPRSGMVLGRSEGLAVASLHAFADGLFAGDRSARVDAAGLEGLDERKLAAAFQVRPGNRMVGLAGRVALMRRLATVLRSGAMFSASGRPGQLFDHLRGSGLTMAGLLGALLAGFDAVWPCRLAAGGVAVDGVAMGDVWRHSALRTDDATSGIIPFHKLTQWLAYSLMEVFEEAGCSISGSDALTGLPEYRNGGLMLDGGILRIRNPALATSPLPIGHEFVVEWRGLTVALLDRLAPMIRDRLGSPSISLGSILQGGTWSMGRKLAAELRPGGGPPLTIESDGTVF